MGSLERKEFYLDGPNDVDWIFYNDTLRRREETIYVDYVGSDGAHWWHDPARIEKMGLPLHMPTSSPILRVMNALNDAGCLSSQGLEVIARIWRPVVLDEDFSWNGLRDSNLLTLNTLAAEGLLKTQAHKVSGIIANEWLFPLYLLDLRKDRAARMS